MRLAFHFRHLFAHLPSRRVTFKQRRFNVNMLNQRWIDVVSTLCVRWVYIWYSSMNIYLAAFSLPRGLHSLANKSKHSVLGDSFWWRVANIQKLFVSCLLVQPIWQSVEENFVCLFVTKFRNFLLPFFYVYWVDIKHSIQCKINNYWYNF